MRRLTELKTIADESLAGLNATDEMRRQIRMKAAEGRQPSVRRFAVPALALACAALICFFGVQGMGNQGQATRTPDPRIASYPLGGDEPGEGRYTSDVGRTNVTIKRDRNGLPSLQQLWAEGSGGTPPLIVWEGRYYRLLNEPASVPQSALGASVGSVEEYTRQIELTNPLRLISNTAQAGTEVYRISGMETTLLAASVNGSLRAFQRVSYNNSAILSGEGLGSTLQLTGHITGMALSGSGAVDNPAEAERLFRILVDSAVFKSSGSVTASQSLIITLDSGLAVQLNVKGEHLGGCGVWSCPEFFDAFQAALN